MFIIDITYKESLEHIDQYLAEHRAFLDNGYKENYFIASGPKNPRISGIIISQLRNREQLEDILKKDPFRVHDVADYKIIEFSPTKYHSNFATFIDTNTT
ncbi:MAG: GTP cyclohydrolase [Gammaproteobacteria bacterium]|nr:GTP cyclohydrolase [Gammaproteobacteria bacterium]